MSNNTEKNIDEILNFAEKVGAESEKEIAFLIAYEKVITPLFKSITGLDYDSSLDGMYPKETQELLSVAKKLYRKRYALLIEKGKRVITQDQIHKPIQIVDYSEKAIAVIGETKTIKDSFLVDGKKIGRFNRNLTINGVKTPGWIFPVKYKEQITQIVNKNNTTQNPFESTTTEAENDEPKHLF